MKPKISIAEFFAIHATAENIGCTRYADICQCRSLRDAWYKASDQQLIWFATRPGVLSAWVEANFMLKFSHKLRWLVVLPPVLGPPSVVRKAARWLRRHARPDFTQATHHAIRDRKNAIFQNARQIGKRYSGPVLPFRSCCLGDVDLPRVFDRYAGAQVLAAISLRGYFSQRSMPAVWPDESFPGLSPLEARLLYAKTLGLVDSDEVVELAEQCSADEA